jgi:glucose uptake protein GlcU
MKISIIIGLICIVMVIWGVIHTMKSDEFNEDQLSARDHWRWKNGGID